MPIPNLRAPLNSPEYDPRWFIWTIVFLVITGISLVSYIVLSSEGSQEVPEFGVSRITKQAK